MALGKLAAALGAAGVLLLLSKPRTPHQPKPAPLPPLPQDIPTTPPPHSGQHYPTGPEREAMFGPPGSRLVTVHFPELQHTNSRAVTLHERAMPSFHAIMRELHSLGLLHNIQSNDGSFANRDVRDQPGLKSAHAYGVAIDLNAATNPLGGDSTPAQNQLAHVFKKHGWYWGGWFPTRPDPMQFEFVGEVNNT